MIITMYSRDGRVEIVESRNERAQFLFPFPKKMHKFWERNHSIEHHRYFRVFPFFVVLIFLGT